MKNLIVFSLIGSILIIGQMGLSNNAEARLDCADIRYDMDIVFLIDQSGSMNGELTSIKANFDVIHNTALGMSLTDPRFAIISFGDDVRIHTDFTSDINTIKNALNLIPIGINVGEASNEAKLTAINGAGDGQRQDVLGNTGMQIGEFTAGYRDVSDKIVILITDEPPSGFDIGADLEDAQQMAELGTIAGEKGIKISDIWAAGGAGPNSESLELDSINSGGLFIVASDNEVTTAIVDIIEQCGGPGLPVDDDGDGFPTGLDCDDSEPNAFPGNPEIDDGIDNDCNGLVDDGLPVDTDGDGILDDVDNCPFTENPNQTDIDGNGVGDACENNSDLLNQILEQIQNILAQILGLDNRVSDLEDRVEQLESTIEELQSSHPWPDSNLGKGVGVPASGKP